MKVADTSALYAIFNDKDAHHADANAQFASLEGVVVPSEILSETLRLIQTRVGPEKARAAAAFLRSAGHVDFQPTPDAPWDDIQAEAWRVFMATPKLTHVDAIVVAWCRRRRLQAWTYDRDLERAARGA